jgi:hypothetical protein
MSINWKKYAESIPPESYKYRFTRRYRSCSCGIIITDNDGIPFTKNIFRLYSQFNSIENVLFIPIYSTNLYDDIEYVKSILQDCESKLNIPLEVNLWGEREYKPWCNKCGNDDEEFVCSEDDEYEFCEI